jgi:hypothetical protein
MKKNAVIIGMLATLVVAGVAAAGGGFSSAKPATYDPKHTDLAGSYWEKGIGCPTNSKETLDGTTVTTYTDAACTSGDSRDSHNYGLLLAKTGPTANWAAAQVVLKNVPGTITELGYDLRKAGVDQNDVRGSHCGAGAPRFDLVDNTGTTYFLGCNSPAPTVAASSNAWLRLRWNPVMAYPSLGGGPVPIAGLTIKQIAIVLDEGQDTGPDNSGLAVLDNIDVNGTLVGK